MNNMENMENNEKQCSRNHNSQSASSGVVYVLGFIGAAIYFISQATGFWMGVLGFFKAMVWPAFLVYEALKALGA
jgi:hypothetical protein